jgi:PKD repeat protein
MDDNNIYTIELDDDIKTFINTTLLEKITSITIPNNSSRVNSGYGRTQVFGYGNVRSIGYGMFANNKRYPELYGLLVELGKMIVPDEIPWTTIQVNHNYKTKKHIDKNNRGYSLSLSFGNFTGGELVVNGNEYQTKNNPLIFNGSLNEHYNKPIKGNRYSLVYFTSAPAGSDIKLINKIHKKIIK